MVVTKNLQINRNYTRTSSNEILNLVAYGDTGTPGVNYDTIW